MSLADLESELVEVIVQKSIEFPEEFNAIEELPSVPLFTTATGSKELSSEGEAAIRDAIQPEIRSIVSPWEDIPKASAFDGPIDEINQALAKLVGSPDLESLELAQDAEIELGGFIPDYMGHVKANLTGWRGETVKALRANYVNRFGPMIAMQCNGLVILRKSLEAEQEIWRQAQDNIEELLSASIKVFDALNFWGTDAQKKVALDMVAMVSSIVGAIISGPGMAIAAAMISATVSVTKDNLESILGRETDNKTEFSIDGSTVNEVWSNMRSAIRGLKNEILAVEDGLAKVVARLRLQFDDQFSIGIDEKDNPILSSGIELLFPPAPGDMMPPGVDTNSDGTVSQDEMVDGIERPTTNYAPPNESDSIL